MKDKKKAEMFTGISFKWRDFRLQDLTEEKINESTYTFDSIMKFIKDNEDYWTKHGGGDDKFNIPKIVIHGPGSNTKWLDISYDALREIAKILKKYK